MTLLQLLIFMLLIHFLADFGLQTHEQATKKGEITKLMESKRGLANQRVSNEKLADNLSKLFE